MDGNLVETGLDGDGLIFAPVAYRGAPGLPLDSSNPVQCAPDAMLARGRAAGRCHALERSHEHGHRLCPAGQEGFGDRAHPIDDLGQEHAFFAAWPVDDRAREHWMTAGERLRALPQTREAFGLIHHDTHPNDVCRTATLSR